MIYEANVFYIELYNFSYERIEKKCERKVWQ